MAKHVGSRVYNSADISIANNTVTALTFNSERYDDDNFHSTVSNTSRLTITSAGKYAVKASVSFAASATGQRQLSFRVNGATFIGADQRDACASGATQVMGSADYEFAAGDYVECMVKQDSGGSLNVQAAGNYSPEFSIMRVG